MRILRFVIDRCQTSGRSWCCFGEVQGNLPQGLSWDDSIDHLTAWKRFVFYCGDVNWWNMVKCLANCDCKENKRTFFRTENSFPLTSKRPAILSLEVCYDQSFDRVEFGADIVSEVQQSWQVFLTHAGSQENAPWPVNYGKLACLASLILPAGRMNVAKHQKDLRYTVRSFFRFFFDILQRQS